MKRWNESQIQRERERGPKVFRRAPIVWRRAVSKAQKAAWFVWSWWTQGSTRN